MHGAGPAPHEASKSRGRYLTKCHIDAGALERAIVDRSDGRSGERRLRGCARSRDQPGFAGISGSTGLHERWRAGHSAACSAGHGAILTRSIAGARSSSILDSPFSSRTRVPLARPTEPLTSLVAWHPRPLGKPIGTTPSRVRFAPTFMLRLSTSASVRVVALVLGSALTGRAHADPWTRACRGGVVGCLAVVPTTGSTRY